MVAHQQQTTQAYFWDFYREMESKFHEIGKRTQFRQTINIMQNLSQPDLEIWQTLIDVFALSEPGQFVDFINSLQGKTYKSLMIQYFGHFKEGLANRYAALDAKAKTECDEMLSLISNSAELTPSEIKQRLEATEDSVGSEASALNMIQAGFKNASVLVKDYINDYLELSISKKNYQDDQMKLEQAYDALEKGESISNPNITFYKLLKSFSEWSLMDLWQKVDLVGKPLDERALDIVYLESNVTSWLSESENIEQEQIRLQGIIDAGEGIPGCFIDLMKTMTLHSFAVLKQFASQQGIDNAYLKKLENERNKYFSGVLNNFLSELSEEELAIFWNEVTKNTSKEQVIEGVNCLPQEHFSEIEIKSA